MGVDRVVELWHVVQLPDDEEDERLVGIYRTEEDAKAAITRLSDKPGFKESPDGFKIFYETPNEGEAWQEGFISIKEAMETEQE